MRKKLDKKINTPKAVIIALGCIIIGSIILFICKNIFNENKQFIGWPQQDYTDVRPTMDVDLLTPNEFSRPGTPLTNVSGIVIHYTANPGSTAKNNRDYFEGLMTSGENYVSSHFVVGIEGEIVQCIPTSEIAYASNSRNDDTISIEVCHLDETGEFTEATYDSLVSLTGWLCLYLNLDPENVIRHYDVTGKICPKYFVDNENAWEQFKKDVNKWALDHS